MSHTDGGLGIGAPVGASEGVLDVVAEGVLDAIADGGLDAVAPVGASDGVLLAPVGASEGVGLQPDRLIMACAIRSPIIK